MKLSGPLSTYQRLEFSHATKKAALKRSGGRCEGTLESGERCPMIFNAANPPEADHVLEAWEGGTDTLENCKMLGAKCCHKAKTAENTKRRKKADRQSHESKWLKRGKSGFGRKPTGTGWRPPKQIHEDLDHDT